MLRGSADLVFPASGGPRHANQGRCWSSSSTYAHTRRDKHTHTHTHTHRSDRAGARFRGPPLHIGSNPRPWPSARSGTAAAAAPCAHPERADALLRKCCQHDRRSHRRCSWCRCSRALAQLLFDLQRCRRFGFHGLHHGSTANRCDDALLLAPGPTGDPNLPRIYRGPARSPWLQRGPAQRRFSV